MTKSDAELILRKLENYKSLDLRGRPYDEAGWIAFHYSCSRSDAEKKIAQARKKAGLITSPA